MLTMIRIFHQLFITDVVDIIQGRLIFFLEIIDCLKIVQVNQRKDYSRVVT